MTLVIVFVNESAQQRTIRRLQSCLYTLYSISAELTDPDNVEERADLVITAENLLDAAIHVTDEIRGIAWQYSLTPEEAAVQENDTDS